MIVFTALMIFVASNTLCFIIDYRKNHPFFFIWIYNIPFIIIPLIYDIYNENLGYSALQFIIFSLLCNLTYVITVILFDSKNNKKLTYSNLIKKNKTYYLIEKTLIYSSTATMIFIILTNISKGNIFSPERGLLTLATLYIIIFLSSYLVKNYEFNKKIFLLTVATMIIYILIFKSRGSLGYFLIPVIFLYLIQKKSSIRLVNFFMIGLFIMFLALFIKGYRWNASSDNIDIYSILDTTYYHLSIIFEKGDLSLHKISIEVFEICHTNSSNECFQWSDIRKLLSLVTFGAIPAELGTSYLIWNMIQGDSTLGGSLHPLSYGVAYFDGGWFGLLYFLLLAALRQITFYAFLSKKFLYGLAPTMYFALFFARGSVYNGFLPLFLALILWVSFEIIKARKNKQHISFNQKLDHRKRYHD